MIKIPQLDIAINALRAKAGAQQFDDAVKKVQRGAKGVDTSVVATGKSISNFGSQIRNVATGLIGFAAAYKGLSFIKTSVKDFAVFEMELANISTMLDEQTISYLPGYEKELSNLAVKYGEATGKLSKGLYDILSASIDAGKAMDVLEIATIAATGGLSDTGVAADVLTTIINAYGMEAEDATEISDILFATVKRGKTTFNELASSLGMVVSLAATAGLSFEEVSAALATMTRSGISTDIAMTSLRGILTTFLSPTNENIAAAKELGLELNSSTLQTIGLTGAVQKLKGATAEEIAAIFSNVRALSGLSALLQSSTGHMKDLAAMTDAAGSSFEAFNKIDRTTLQQLEQTQQLWLAIKRDLGKGIQPEVNLWMQGLNLLVKEWSDGWKIMAYDMKISQALIKEGLSDTGENKDFIQAMLEADEAIRKLSDASYKLSTGLDRIERMEIEIAPMPVVDLPELSEADKKLIESKKKAGLAVTELFNELKAERDLIGLTTEERERAIKVLELEKQAKILLGDKSEEMVELYRKELMELQNLYIEAEKTQEFYRRIEEGVEGIIRSPLRALLDETRDIEEVLKDELRNLAVSVLEMMYEDVITKPLMNAIKAGAQPALEALSNMITGFLSGISRGIVGGFGNVIGGMIGGLFGFGAPAAGAVAPSVGPAPETMFAEKGLILDRGSIKPFDKGGILTQPTIFPMSNGGIALGAEKRTEAIMPLMRDAGGRLGVKAEGGQSSSTPIKIINVMDQSQVQEYLGSGDGERQIVNIMRRNSEEIRDAIG